MNNKLKQDLLHCYESELRSIIQFASPLKCEGLAVNLLRRFSEEMQELIYKEASKISMGKPKPPPNDYA